MVDASLATQRLSLPITGMHCAGCAARIETRLKSEPGVIESVVNLATDTLNVVTGDPMTVTRLAGLIDDLGFAIAKDRFKLEIEGMHCAGCARTIERRLTSLAGTIQAEVNPALETATVQTVRGTCDTASLIEAVEAVGYRAHLKPSALEPDASRTEAISHQSERLQLWASIILTAPLVGQMIGMALGFKLHLPVWAELALATPVQFWIGWRFYQGAFKALINRSGNMDQLVALGTSAAYFYSLFLVLTQGSLARGHLFFEAAAVIITLILLGKYLESRAKRSASAALRQLMELQPQKARILRAGQETEVAIHQVGLGDIVIVRPGERLPVDGQVLRGESEIDESLVTGESLPVLRQKGDPVVAGSLNGVGSLQIRTDSVGSDTTLARIAELVSRAQSGKAPIQRLVDRISAIFVPVVIMIALITILVWLGLGHGLEPALIAGISVLVIACPCALGLATPTALVAGTGVAARHGILIADIKTLESAHMLDVMVFDKTGTLTLGQPEVTDIVAAVGVHEQELMALAASAQQDSEHPLGRSMLKAASDRALELRPAGGFQAKVGQGIEAVVDDRLIRIGKRNFVIGDRPTETDRESIPDAGSTPGTGFGPDDRSNLDIRAEQLEQGGRTVTWVTADGLCLGLIAMADSPREDAAQAIAQLKANGIETLLLTGDNAVTAGRIASQLGIDSARADLLPDDKVAAIEQLKKQGKRVGMVGDGINDAPALAAADVGFAMGGGAAVAAEAAGITLMQPRPSLITAAMSIARQTSHKIRQNLFWAFIYNLIGLPIAAMGLLNPAVAGAAMALSSVSVVTNSLLLKRWQPASTRLDQNER